MAEPKIYPKGIVTFQKNEKAPDFVLGTMVITPNDFMEWIKENKSLLTEYNGKSQIRLQILNGNKGIYLIVDTFKPTGATNGVTTGKEPLPF